MSPETGKKDATYAFARYVATTQYENIPPEAIEATKTIISTTLGTAIGASTTVPVCQQMMKLARETAGREESTIIAYGGKVSCYMAAFVNSALAHGLNFEDGSDKYHVHTGIAVVPPAFAVAEKVGKVSGKELITACTLGVDIMVRLSRAIHTKTSRNWQIYGWAPEQIFGYIPAAAVAGRLLGLNEDELVRAFGLAYSQTAGVMEEISGIGADKAIYCSYSGMAGVLAALMAQMGICGPRDSLEGKNGLYHVYFQGEYDAASLTRDLGRSFEGVGLSFYPYPCSAGLHSYIEAALLMVQEHHIRPQDIAAVTLLVGDIEKKATGYCDPLEVKRNPPALSDAQMSLPFAVATAFAKGKPRLQHFVGEGFKDPTILRLSNKVTCEYDARYGWDNETGMMQPGIEVKLTDGRVLRSERKVFRYGSPRHPMSRADHIAKFKDCAAYSIKPLSQDKLDSVIAMLTGLEDVNDVRQIIWSVS